MSKPSGAKCAVLHCTSKQRDGARLFKYSTNYLNHELWLKHCGIISFSKKRIFVCSNHFETSFFLKRKLKLTAVPTLCLPRLECQSGVSSALQIPLSSEVNTVNEKYNLPETHVLHSKASHSQKLNKSPAQIPKPTNFDLKNFKTYTKIQEEDNISLSEIAQLPDPYFDDVLHVEPSPCAYCEKNEKNIEAYRSINRKYFIRINKLQNDKTKLLKKIKNLERKIIISNKKLSDLKNKPQPCLDDLIDKQNKSEHSKNFCRLLLSDRTKQQKWPEAFKVLVQNIYYRSPKSYNFMRDRLNFDLPSKSSLLRWQPIKNFFPGTNNDIMVSRLKEKINTLKEMDKQCSLIFDEIKIRKDLKYNTIRDCVDGFVDFGDDGRNPKIGSYICVFMVRGLIGNWKNILSYYVSENAISSNFLTKLIQSNIELCSSLSLTVRAVICDQGSNNRKALNNFGANNENGILSHDAGYQIVSIFDPPHLFKSFRNCLLTFDIETPNGIASWQVIRELYKLEQIAPTQMCPKLTDKHVNPGHFDKMKVKLSTQVFSRSVVAGMKTAFELNKFSVSVRNKVPGTIHFFDNLDKLFDCLNSKNVYNPNKFKCALRFDENCAVFKFLEEMLIYMQQIKLVNRKKVYSFEGMVQTIRGVISLLKSLTSGNLEVRYILTSRLNQDALENTFSLIRSANGNNFNPSVQEFSYTVAKLLSIKYLTPFTGLTNCEDDSDAILLDVIQEDNKYNQSLRENCEPVANDTQESSNSENKESDIDDCLIVIEIEDEINDTIGSLSSQSENILDPSNRYFTGYLVNRILKKFNCVLCAITLLKETDFIESTSELLIKHKNYMSDDFGRLQAPSQEFYELCQKQILIFDSFFKENAHIVNLKFTIVDLLLNEQSEKEFYDLHHHCYNHRVELLNLMILILIRKHCKWRMERDKLNKSKIRTTKRQWRTVLN